VDSHTHYPVKAVFLLSLALLTWHRRLDWEAGVARELQATMNDWKRQRKMNSLSFCACDLINAIASRGAEIASAATTLSYGASNLATRTARDQQHKFHSISMKHRKFSINSATCRQSCKLPKKQVGVDAFGCVKRVWHHLIINAPKIRETFKISNVAVLIWRQRRFILITWHVTITSLSSDVVYI